MGAWGTGIFDNDTACDWAFGLEEVDDLSLVSNALSKVIAAETDYLDSDVATEALAAGEVVARLKGKWGTRNSYSEPVDKWIESHPLPVDADLTRTAIAAIDRILTPPSELLELWKEGEYKSQWLAAVAELKTRIE